MGIDSKLLVSAKWNVQHIQTLLVEGLGHKLIKADHKGDHSFLYIELPSGAQRMIYVARTTGYGGLDATLLSFRSNPEGIELFRSIANVLGGFLCESDHTSDFEMIQEPHDSSARFVLDYVILRDALTDSADLSDKIADAVGYDKPKRD